MRFSEGGGRARPTRLMEGDRVRLLELGGMEGRLDGFDAERGQWRVRVDGLSTVNVQADSTGWAAAISPLYVVVNVCRSTKNATRTYRTSQTPNGRD